MAFVQAMAGRALGGDLSETIWAIADGVIDGVLVKKAPLAWIIKVAGIGVIPLVFPSAPIPKGMKTHNIGQVGMLVGMLLTGGA